MKLLFLLLLSSSAFAQEWQLQGTVSEYQGQTWSYGPVGTQMTFLSSNPDFSVELMMDGPGTYYDGVDVEGNTANIDFVTMNNDFSVSRGAVVLSNVSVGQYVPQGPQALRAPEIDPNSAAAGLTLLLGGLMVMRGRREK